MNREAMVKLVMAIAVVALAVSSSLASAAESRAHRSPGASVAATSAAQPSAAAGPAAKLTAAQREITAAFVSAANARNIDAMRKLVAPRVLACFNEVSKAFLDRWLKDRLHHPIPPNYRVSFSPLAHELGASSMFTLPAAPTATMKIEFGGGTTGTTVIIQQVREQSGKLFLIVPCPTAMGLAHFLQTEQRRAKAAKSAREISAKLQDPVRTQLTTLIKQGKEGEAVLVCIRRLNLDGLTARAVVDLLAGRKPD